MKRIYLFFTYNIHQSIIYSPEISSLKFDENVLNENLREKLININFTCSENTCGPKSISKQELIEEFNNLIE